VFRKIGRRKLVPYYDRAQIEDGAIAGRGLEIVWLKSQTDLLFVQIQGSARVKLADGSLVRINYAAHNGYPYTPVGRILIERNIVPREQMSMQRIRQYMEENPGAAAELRRQNRAYVFFREVALRERDEAVGAQGVPLTPGRSIAVDKALHVYGTPFFIDAELPTGSDRGKTPFRRLMVAQDTGSAIVGPARADIYFGAGGEAGRIAGRIKDSARFVMLLPKALDPLAQGRTMPLPATRPSAKIARLYPQSEPSGEKPDGGHQEQLKEPFRRQPKKDAVPVTEAQALPGQALSEQVPSARAEPVSEPASPQSAPLPVARPRNAPAPQSPADAERKRP
jgi:membrane-bound lytic murein transglycosylase A